MTPHEIALQCGELITGNGDLGELSETRINAVDRLGTRHGAVDDIARDLHTRPRFRGQSDG